MAEQQMAFNTEDLISTAGESFTLDDIATIQRCSELLSQYLETKGQSLSSDSVSAWMADNFSCFVGEQFRDHGAALMLQEYVNSATNVGQKPEPVYSKKLCLDFYHLLRLYTYDDKLTLSRIRTRKLYGSKVLLLFQEKGAFSIQDLTLPVISASLKAMEEAGRYPVSYKAELHSTTKQILQMLYDMDLVPYSYTLAVQILTCFNGYQDSWLQMSLEQIESIRAEAANTTEIAMTVQELIQTRDKIASDFTRNYQKKNSRHTFLHHMNQLIVFLDYHGIKRYTARIGELWTEYVILNSSLQLRRNNAYRRAIFLLNSDLCKKGVDLRNRRSRANVFLRLPDWCRKTAYEYLSRKEGEGLSASTLCMIRSSIARFLIYIDSKNIHRFCDITAETIYDFVLYDPHHTTYGKNAYIFRIRHFLDYLEEVGLVSKNHLSLAMHTARTTSTRNVKVLSSSNQETMLQACAAEESELSLRSKAILLLGMDMCLRSIDVVSLRIDDIHWERQTITVRQCKTKYEIELAMPTRVGNAIYEYIMRERPIDEDPHVFLTVNSPYRPLSRHRCSAALKQLFPEQQSFGFHILRRTGASNALNRGSDLDEVVELLGHQDRSTVQKYLSLDEQRMKQCAISLQEYGMEGGHFQWKN